ncbi:MAG: class I SAM-dependent methyltransferase [Vicingaceae bacterium]
MNKSLIKDIVDWDTVNWSKAIPFWEKHATLNQKPLKCLELGCNNGGLSLWLAQKGHEVVCSDLENPEMKAKSRHEKYGELQISYQAINALEIPFKNEFDIIVFKSILGGVSRGDNQKNKKAAVDQIHKALKPGGKLLFAENLTASKMHQFLRKHFIKWGADWNYLQMDEVDWLFSDFNKINYKTVGFFGAFGRSESQRKLLGKIDSVIDPALGSKIQYILIGVAEK